MLALAFEMGMPIHFVAPAFGFQKNIPYPDNDELRQMVTRIWKVCEKFEVSIGFHSGSGKSAENYRLVGEITGSRLEIKTSGRYTYEMGRALHASTNPADQALWSDWYAFTLELAVSGCFSQDETERSMARDFVAQTLEEADAVSEAETIFASPEACRVALQALEPSPITLGLSTTFSMFSLRAAALKSRPGRPFSGRYRQRCPFLLHQRRGPPRFAQNAAKYILFLAETTGPAPAETCEVASNELNAYPMFADFLAGIAST